MCNLESALQIKISDMDDKFLSMCVKSNLMSVLGSAWDSSWQLECTLTTEFDNRWCGNRLVGESSFGQWNTHLCMHIASVYLWSEIYNSEEW
jgi:hypothetical protein